MNLAQISRWVMAAAVTAKPSKAARVEQRVKDGVCLCCDENAQTRGVCDKHYRLFLRRMREHSGVREQAEFEAKAIKEGLILPQHEARTIKRTDPFMEL